MFLRSYGVRGENSDFYTNKLLKNQRPPFIEKVAATIAKHPWRVLFVVVVLAGFAVWGVSTLKIYTARNALFPKYIDVYQRLESFLQKFGAVSELVVVVEDAPQSQLKEFATELAGRLRQPPPVQKLHQIFAKSFRGADIRQCTWGIEHSWQYKS